MKGSYRVIVQNKRIRYDFEIRRNLTIIRGDSATGKTTLVEMIREYYENGISSGIQLQCDRECSVLSGRNWKADLAGMKESIVFIDEGNEFVFTDEFASAIQQTDNYYVIITREGVPSLPYSVEEIYGIRDSGKYGTLKRTYNEFFPLYRKMLYNREEKFDTIITEDSNSGYQFFKEIADKAEIACISAGGKSNMFEAALKADENCSHKKILLIADGAAFGAEMEKMVHLIEIGKEVVMYLPESFEWLILKSGVVGDGTIEKLLLAPEEHIDSQKYFSWERFFTALLVDVTKDTYLKYGKRVLNKAYLNPKIRDKILQSAVQE